MLLLPLTPITSSPGLISLSAASDHRTPHSFPTRRSSDLRADDLDHRRRRGGERVRRHPHGWTGEAAPRGRRPQDRKSTRLNSSHLVISYAVFCLKKKKTE